jgi:hypothetical protein
MSAYRRLIPLLLLAALLLAMVPLFHPYEDCNCSDWLVQWGLSSHARSWETIHQAAMAGFMLLGMAGIFMAFLGAPSVPGVLGGAMLGAGGLLSGGVILIHASAISSLGRAYNAATTVELKAILAHTATAFVVYDASATGVSTVLVSGGAALLALKLWRERVVSGWMAAFLVALTLAWVGPRYGLFTRVLHFSLPEPLRWAALCLWTVGVAAILATARPAARESA